jgi:hypothetical protein
LVAHPINTNNPPISTHRIRKIMHPERASRLLAVRHGAGETAAVPALDADGFINQAIDDGQARGLAALGDLAGLVYVIAEAEGSCDKDGIDSFIDRYGPAGLAQLARAYAAIGAELLAAACRAVLESMPSPTENTLDRLNTFVTERAGYDYQSIRAMVARALGS